VRVALSAICAAAPAIRASSRLRSTPPSACRQSRSAANERQKSSAGPVARLEDADLLQGTARFIDDARIPGMLEAAFVRSPHAHAAIRGIDKSAALALPACTAYLCSLI
jgi:carbon-monoxide dehydrogenase large subunit